MTDSWRRHARHSDRHDPDGALRLSLDYLAFPGAMDALPPDIIEVLRSNMREWEAIMTSTDAFPSHHRGRVARSRYLCSSSAASVDWTSPV